MALEDYTHLLNLITWFDEASIQSKLNNDFNGNKGTADVEAITEPALLDVLRAHLVATRNYLFNKPDVTSSSTFLVPSGDVTIAATWAGVGKNLISSGAGDHIVGSKLVFEEWKEKAWNNEHETGLFHNTFKYLDEDHIGIAVSMLDVVIVIIIKTSEDNSKKPRRPNPSGSDSSDGRGVCTDGLDIAICDDEEEDDDCVVEALCDTNFQPAN